MTLLSFLFIVKDTEAIESVQRRFTKPLPGLSYTERVKSVNLHSFCLQLRRLYTDLFYCYKILFGLLDLVLFL